MKKFATASLSAALAAVVVLAGSAFAAERDDGNEATTLGDAISGVTAELSWTTEDWDGHDGAGGADNKETYHCNNLGSPAYLASAATGTGSNAGNSWYTVDPGGAAGSCGGTGPLLVATGYIDQAPIQNPSCNGAGQDPPRNECEDWDAAYVGVVNPAGADEDDRVDVGQKGDLSDLLP